jgi:hypothetical protein
MWRGMVSKMEADNVCVLVGRRSDVGYERWYVYGRELYERSRHESSVSVSQRCSNAKIFENGIATSRRGTVREALPFLPALKAWWRTGGGEMKTACACAFWRTSHALFTAWARVCSHGSAERFSFYPIRITSASSSHRRQTCMRLLVLEARFS